MLIFTKNQIALIIDKSFCLKCDNIMKYEIKQKFNEIEYTHRDGWAVIYDILKQTEIQ